MFRILHTSRYLLSSLVVALPVIALSSTITLAPDGRFGVSVAEAKGKGGKSSAKGQRGGQQVVTTERSGGKRKASTDRERGRSVKTQDHRQERQARQDRQERDVLDHRRDRQADQENNHYRDPGQRQDQEGATASEDYGHTEAGNPGATSSQLKHRNAARASESAFQNASSNSNVGRISTYRDAARATLDKERDIDLLDRDIANVQRERDLAIAEGRFVDADAADVEILRLEDERFLAEGDLIDLRLSEREAYNSVGGPELNEHDYHVFRSMLGLE